MSTNETSIYAIAHSNLRSHLLNNETRTLRVIVYVNVSFTTLKIKLSNLYGEKPVRIGGIVIGFSNIDGVIIDTTSLMELKFEDEKEFSIPPSTELFTDKVNFTAEKGDFVSVSIYYPEDETILSGNHSGDFALRSLEGDYTKFLEMPHTEVLKVLSNFFLPSDVTTSITTIKEIVVETTDKPNVLAVFGDSITRQGTWTMPLTEMLYAEMPNEISVLNLGISGNRLCHNPPGRLYDSYGEAGDRRYVNDLLPLHGLTHVIIALGSNDLGLPRRDNRSKEELITLEDYENSQRTIVDALRKTHKGIKVYAVTILPRRVNRIYLEERDIIRRILNQWIRTTDLFDAIIDFDKFTQDVDEKTLRQNWFLIDGLHLTEEGGLEISKKIPLDLFK